MTTKPDFSEGLGRTWNDSGANNSDPDVIEPGKYDLGWVIENPAVEFMNFVQKFVTQLVNHINEEGIAIWDVETEYPINAFTKGSDGELYKSNTATTGDDPTTEPEWDLFSPGGALDSDDITNVSSVTGATVTNALETLDSDIGALSSDNISNASTVPGAAVTDALNILLTALNGLGSDNIANESGVGGATVSDALDALDAGGGAGIIGLIRGSDISNNTTTNAEFFTATAAAADEHYMLEGLIEINGVNTEGVVIDIDADGTNDGAAFISYNVDNAAGADATNHNGVFGGNPLALSITAAESSVTGATFLTIKGFYNTNATPGNLTFNFRKIASVSQEIIIREGSWIRLTPGVVV